MIVRVALTAGPSLKASAIIPKSNGPSRSLIKTYNSFHQLPYIKIWINILEFLVEFINFIFLEFFLSGEKLMMLNILTQRGFPKLEHRLLSMYSLFIFFLLIFNIGAIIAPKIQCVSTI